MSRSQNPFLAGLTDELCKTANAWDWAKNRLGAAKNWAADKASSVSKSLASGPLADRVYSAAEGKTRPTATTTTTQPKPEKKFDAPGGAINPMNHITNALK